MGKISKTFKPFWKWHFWALISKKAEVQKLVFNLKNKYIMLIFKLHRIPVLFHFRNGHKPGIPCKENLIKMKMHNVLSFKCYYFATFSNAPNLNTSKERDCVLDCRRQSKKSFNVLLKSKSHNWCRFQMLSLSLFKLPNKILINVSH